MKSFAHGVEELQKILELGRQHWLLGAGASVVSGIPLMYQLSSRVGAILSGAESDIVKRITADLPGDAHIEHVLSHLGDLIALAERSKSKTARIDTFEAALAGLEKTYKAVIQAIAVTVRCGYRANPEEIGTADKPIVAVEAHRNFVKQIFKNRANLESRSRVGFITTNYDTLLEDALAMEHRIPLDGFSGSAIAFWTGENIDPNSTDSTLAHKVLKLHGSVDWFRDPSIGLLRVRYGVNYLADLSNTLIYPQATKYVETQKDPFAKIFDCFRKSLLGSESHLLAVIGYSFGDNHINAEIESALASRDNKTMLVAFSKEVPVGTGTDTTLCPTLDKWAKGDFGSRIYVATDKALYHGANRVEPTGSAPLNWWTFAGVTSFLETGAVT